MIRLEKYPDCALLSFQEERVLPWIANNRGLASNVNAAISSGMVVDRALLQQCLQAACNAYDALRTRFRKIEDGSFRRHVLPGSECLFELTELHSALPQNDPALVQQVSTFCDKPISIEDEIWFRALLVHTVDGASIIVLSMPHIVSDAVSIRMLIANVWEDYACLAEGKPMKNRTPCFSLRDFAGSQRAWAATPDFGRKLDELADLVTTGIVRIRSANQEKYAEPPSPSRPSFSVKRRLPPEHCVALEALAQRTQTGLPTVLIACTVLAIAKLFHRQEFCFRLPVTNRVLPGSHDMVGFLSNDVPIFVSIDEGQDVLSFIKSINRNALLMTMRFGAMPWSVLTERLLASPVLQSGRNPFDDYLINAFPVIENPAPGDGYEAYHFPMSTAAFTNNDLKVWLQRNEGRITVTLKVGIEQQELAEQHYAPVVLGVFADVARHADDRIGACLA